MQGAIVVDCVLLKVERVNKYLIVRDLQEPLWTTAARSSQMMTDSSERSLSSRGEVEGDQNRGEQARDNTRDEPSLAGRMGLSASPLVRARLSTAAVIARLYIPSLFVIHTSPAGMIGPLLSGNQLSIPANGSAYARHWATVPQMAPRPVNGTETRLLL